MLLSDLINCRLVLETSILYLWSVFAQNYMGVPCSHFPGMLKEQSVHVYVAVLICAVCLYISVCSCIEIMCIVLQRPVRGISVLDGYRYS